MKEWGVAGVKGREGEVSLRCEGEGRKKRCMGGWGRGGFT